MNSLKDLENAASGTQVDLTRFLGWISFNEQGLVPAIAQDHATGAVLMLAWMNREAIEQTLTTGRVVYFSRSRQALWRKGDTSGNTQGLVSLRFDCDADAILLSVNQQAQRATRTEHIVFISKCAATVLLSTANQ